MKSFLGLPIFRKPLSDSEYVEQVRRDLLRFRRYGKRITIFWIAMYIIWMSFIAWLFLMGIRLIGNQGLFPLGVIFGFCIASAIMLPTVEIVRQLLSTSTISRESRTSELLLKYHDALVNLSRQESETKIESAS